MKELLTTIETIKPHHSFAVIVDEIEREMAIDYLKNNLQNHIFIDIERLRLKVARLTKRRTR